MNNFGNIQTKLKDFINRYYTNDLIKGCILFLSIGLLYLLFTLFIEYLFWLNPSLRTLLFWTFVIVEVFLFGRFILWPILRLLKFKKGIDFETASVLIGKHFPEVDDKLLNVLQLHKSADQSELLLASIEQKAAQLHPVPFYKAVDYFGNLKYLKYLAVPLVIITIIFGLGEWNWFGDSYQRVVNYNLAYEPPAPFQFIVLNDNLEVSENSSLKLQIETVGKIIPENSQIHYQGEMYFLKQVGVGRFEYEFANLREGIKFNLSGNAVKSKTYQIYVKKVPSIVNFEMQLKFPDYINRADESLKGTGNANVPEGTKIEWKVKTKNTDHVVFYAKDTSALASAARDLFSLHQQVFSNLDYNVAVNGESPSISDEELHYQIKVIPDAFPKLNITVERDSTDLSLYFYGQATDDYGLKDLRMIYYPTDNEEDIQFESLPIEKGTFSEFFAVFPNNINLEAGISYNILFELKDNDPYHPDKITRSQIYHYRKLTNEEVQQEQLLEQRNTLKDLQMSAKRFKQQDEELDKLNKLQKEKQALSFSDKQKLQEFLKRQEQQESLMRNFNKRLQENLNEFQKDNVEKDPFKEALQERLKDNEAQLQKDEKLLKELQHLQDKIQKENLSQRLDEMKKHNKNKEKSLAQLVELTKRYYVSKKVDKLQRDLEEMSNKQMKISEQSKQKNRIDNQKELNRDFDDLRKELEELQKDNEGLKKPLAIPNDKVLENAIKQDQEKATENLKMENELNQKGDSKSAENEAKQAKNNQKEAAKKMQEMSKGLSQGLMAGGQEQMQEDVTMLRQILDNLLLFSFDQEDLMDNFKAIQINHNEYGKFLRRQSNLRDHFAHVEDSLFALSLRQPKMSEEVNAKISDVYFYIDKAMDQLSENIIFQGVAAQQYAITASNDLANILSDILDNMESDLNAEMGQGGGQGQGQGEGSEGQLPDIIMGQDELNKEMQEAMKQGDQGKEGDQGSQDGDGDKGESKSGSEGEGKEGNGTGDASSDGMNGELYRIYQEQQKLRQALEDRLKRLGLDSKGQNILRQMEKIENDLINSGLTNQTLQRMMNLKHELLKLENAAFQQGENEQRESETNTKSYQNRVEDQLPRIKEYFNTTEILNRQALPLQRIYQEKVQEYFKREND